MSTQQQKKPVEANKEAEKKDKNAKDAKQPEEENLSEEDQLLKEKLEMLLDKCGERDVKKRDESFAEIIKEVQGATTSLTSVPKPLKFLSFQYKRLVEMYEQFPDSDFRMSFAELVSCIGMVSSEDEKPDCLMYCLKGHRKNLVQWGHEYLRCLAGQIGKQYDENLKKGDSIDDLLQLVDQIIPEFINHNEEGEAVDLMMEVEQLDKLQNFTNQGNYERVCGYLLACSEYAADTEELTQTLRTAYGVFRKFDKFTDAVRVAQKLNDMDLIKELMTDCKDRMTLKQMAFMLARQRNPYTCEDDDEITKIVSNERLSEHYKNLGRELNVVEPKHPDQIFKTHLEDKRFKYGAQGVDHAKKNLAITYVNAFVNAGFGSDLLISNQEASEDWVFKNKDDGQTAAAASLGMLLLWDIDEGFSQIDKYMERREHDIVAGSFMALGLVNSGITNECDPVQAILIDKLETCKEEQLKIGALMGLSFTYAATARVDLLEAISPIILDDANSTRLQAVAALSIGLIFVGTCDDDAAQSILQILMEKEEEQLNDPFTRMFALGLGLLFLGQQAKAEATMEVCKLIQNQKFADFVELVVETCAYAGSGNVLKVQKMLHLCAEHKTEEKETLHQIAAVVGVALIAFGEQIGTDMCLRTMQHLLQYGEPSIRKTVPLAVGLLRVSNPDVKTLDMLNKLAYDSDADVAQSAIFALGLVGAGTNNSKLAGNLRFLASYYQGSETTQGQLFLVRIAQGLVHMGKGLLGLNPFHSDKFLFSNVSLAGLLTTVMAGTDMSTFFCGKHHYFLYYLTLSMYPRMLVTLNEDLEPIKTNVRVGQAIDNIGAPGKVRRITGFQTHETPVLMGHGERAEFETEEYVADTRVLENFVVMKKNPDYEAPVADKKRK